MSDEKLRTHVRREQIAEAALGLIASRGVRGLSVAALARRVGLVPSGIYRHFSSKDEIVDAVLIRLEQRLLDNVRAARQETDDPLQRLRGVLMRHIRFIREGRAIPRIIFSDEVYRGDPNRKRQVGQILARYRDQVQQLVRQGQQEGSIRQDLDVETVSLMLLGIAVPAGILWHLTDGGFDVTKHAKRAWLILRRAIVPDGE